MQIPICKRVLCCLLAVLILCTCVVRPLTVKAVEPVSLGVGAAACLIALTSGVLLRPKTAEDVVAIGNSLIASLNQWADTEQKQTDVIAFFADASGLVSAFPDAPKDPNFPSGLKIATRAILAGLATWLCTVISVGGVGGDPVVAPDGWTYYGEHLLPTFPSTGDYPYLTLVRTDKGYAMLHSDVTFYLKSDTYSTNLSLVALTACNRGYYWASTEKLDSWDLSSSYQYVAPVAINAGKNTNTYWTEYLWSNYDLLSYKDGSLVVPASFMSSVNVDVDFPSIYVGDIPNQVKNGEKDEEDVQKIIPPDISLDNLYNGQTNLEDFLSDTLDKLSSGQMTYDQYMDSISGSGSGGDVVDPPGDSDQPGGSVEIPDLAPYALDLKDFFPFCIPFDIYNFFSALIAAPEAPQFHWEIRDLSGRAYPIDIDLSCWDSLAATFRTMQLLLFIVGLAVASRKFIKW